MAITTLARGLRVPDHGEPVNTWDDDVNAGLIAHDAHVDHWSETVPFREVHVDDDLGSDSYAAGVIGRQDMPYKTLAAAVAAIPNGGNIGQATGTKIVLHGSNAVTSGTPTQIYPTGGATILLPAFTWIVGGGADADRSRASCLVQDTVAGALLELGSRYVKLENFGVRNLSTSAGACGVMANSASGGMQNFEFHRLHVYGCRQGVIIRSFNVDGSRITQSQFSNNRREGLIFETNGTDAPNQCLVQSTDISQNNTDVVAGIYNVSCIADSGGSTNLIFDQCKIHGFAGRFDIQGWNNLWIQNGYYEIGSNGYGGQYDDIPLIRVTSNPNGTTTQYWAYNINVVGNRFHSPHGGVMANWTAGMPIVADVDRCSGFHFERNLLDDNVDIDSTNPALRFGADCQDITFTENRIIGPGARAPFSDVATLYTASASLPPYNLRGDFLGDVW